MKTNRNQLKTTHRFMINYASIGALRPAIIQIFMRLQKEQQIDIKQNFN